MIDPKEDALSHFADWFLNSGEVRDNQLLYMNIDLIPILQHICDATPTNTYTTENEIKTEIKTETKLGLSRL